MLTYTTIDMHRLRYLPINVTMFSAENEELLLIYELVG